MGFGGGGFVPTLLVLLRLAGAAVGGGPVASGDGGGGDGGGGSGGGELGLELCADDVVMSGHENLMYFLGQQIQVWMACPSSVSPSPPSISRSRSSQPGSTLST